MNPKNKRTLFLTSTICIILSIVAFALSHMGGASNENYILLYVIAVLLNIVLNLALSIKIASTNGAKALVSLGKWIMPIAGVVYLIPQVYSVLFPAKTMQDTYWYVFIGILFIVSGNYFPKNHINPYIGLKFPWLFNDEEGWYKTHRLGSYTWILAGIVSILHPLHNLVFVTVPLIIFLVGIVPLVYAEKVNGVWEQRLRIHYNCVGTIEIPSALPLPTPDVSVNTRKGVVVNYAPCDVAI